MIQAALEYSGGRFAIENVYDDLMSGQQTLWVAIDDKYNQVGCTTVSITQYPTGVKALCYEHLGGKDVTKWLEEGHRVCSAYARELGCTKLECQGRSGWLPFLKKLGYRQFAVRYEFDLKD